MNSLKNHWSTKRKICKFAILLRLISHCSAVHTLPLLHKLDPWVFTYRCVKDKRIFNVIVRIAKKHFHNIFLTFFVILLLEKVAGHIKICFLFSKNKIVMFLIEKIECSFLFCSRLSSDDIPVLIHDKTVCYLGFLFSFCYQIYDGTISG